LHVRLTRSRNLNIHRSNYCDKNQTRLQCFHRIGLTSAMRKVKTGPSLDNALWYGEPNAISNAIG
jgi:hypothetical protein